jgi:hypothetical protein
MQWLAGAMVWQAMTRHGPDRYGSRRVHGSLLGGAFGGLDLTFAKCQLARAALAFALFTFACQTLFIQALPLLGHRIVSRRDTGIRVPRPG